MRIRKSGVDFQLAVISLLCVNAAKLAFCAAVTVKQVKDNGKSAIVMENPFVRLTIDLHHGARVTQFLNKQTGHEWVGSGQGIFADHVWQQTWPGELYDTNYDGKIEKSGPGEGVVTVWRVLQAPGQKDITGVRIERTLRLRDDSSAIEATVKLTNEADGPRSVGYWSQNIFSLGGPTDNYYIRPSARSGLSVAFKEYRDNGREQASLGEEWVKDPVAGWTAAVNPRDGEAAVFLMDYNDLRWLYNCIGVWTTEWYYDLLRMVPGREWRTRIVLLPLTGYAGVTYASERLVADIGLRKRSKGFQALYTFGAGVHPSGKATIEAELLALPGRRSVARETLNLDQLAFNPQRLESSLDLSKAPGDFAIRVRVVGDGPLQTFEKTFERKSLSDHLAAGYPSIAYPVARPLKKKSLQRPNPLAMKSHPGIAVLEVRGMYYPYWRLAQALNQLGEHRVQPAHFVTNVYGDRLDYFPAGYAEMLSYDAVVLEDIPAEAIGEEGLAMLKDYVDAGGGLLVCGGWYSFGGGGYAGTPLGELLPVAGSSPPGIRWEPKGLPLCINQSAAPLDFSSIHLSSDVYWYQQVQAIKSGTTIAVKAGDRPFVVTSTFGKGRVACLLGTPCGSPSAGQIGFWDDPAWIDILATTLRWLMPHR